MRSVFKIVNDALCVNTRINNIKLCKASDMLLTLIIFYCNSISNRTDLYEKIHRFLIE